MVIIEVYGSNGKMIPYEKISTNSYDGKKIKLLLETLPNFSNIEWLTLLQLLAKAIDYGGEVEEIRNYIELFDKIKKIVDQNNCK